MKHPGSWMERLAEGMDLSGQSVPGQPLVEICGGKRVLIENHRGVSRYSEDGISIRVSYGEVMIGGRGLKLARMTKQQLVICGFIEAVTLIRREKQ